MANRWLYAGGDTGTVRTTSGTLSSNTSSSLRNTTYTDHVVSITSGPIICDFVDSAGASDSVTSGETLWLRVYFYVNGASTLNLVEILNSSDQPWLAIRRTASATAGLYYNSNTGASPTWTQIGSSFTIPSNGLGVFDLKCTLGSPHSAEAYVAAALVASGTFTQASFTAADAFAMRPLSGSTEGISEMMATVGISTVGGHVYYGKPSGAGSNSGWTGAYTTIDDVGIDDTDMISSGTAAQRSTFAYADVPTLASGYTIGDLFMWTRAKNDGSNPTNVKPVRRDSGGTDNVGSSFSGMGAGFAEFLIRYSSITPTEYNASEFGVESAA